MTILHYWRLYRLYRVYLSRTNALRELFRATPF